MPKRGAFALGLTALALALLLNFQTPTEVPPITGVPGGTGTRGGTTGSIPGGPSASGSGSSGSGSTGSGSSGRASPVPATPGPTAPGSGSSGGTTSGTSGTRTITGPTVDMRWGPVQVSVTLKGRQLVDITAIQMPVGGRSGRISGYVEPILHSEALQAQSAQIDGVSGATYTSQAYAQSLQAALDSAGT
jgi:FMN-binding domain